VQVREYYEAMGWNPETGACAAGRGEWAMGMPGAQRSYLRSLAFVCGVTIVLPLLLWCCAAYEARVGQPIRLDLAKALSERTALMVKDVGDLASGGRQTFRFDLPDTQSLDLRVRFAEAPFNGTQLNAEIDGKRLLPYFAFGGDTRYDNVKDKAGMRPPVAIIEGRWLIPAAALREENNELIIWTTGVRPDETLERIGPKPVIRISGVSIGPAEGHALPVYSNSVYFDFDVWPMGYPWSDRRRHLDYLALLGVLNGKGMLCVGPNLGGPEESLWGVKRFCEENALGWGFGHQEFYTIWEFADKPQLWAKFLDVDNNPETQFDFWGIYPSRRQRGADAVVYDVEKLTNALEPPIRVLAPYTDFYNFRCEQGGAKGEGFGPDGERLAAYGVHGDVWVRSNYEAIKAAHDLVMKYDPDDGRVQEMHLWTRPSLRNLLYDTALKRKQPMSSMIDILMTHFNNLPHSYDRLPGGKFIERDMFQVQYPGAPWTPLHYAEIPIDFNRYRLGRSRKDIAPGRPVTTWGNGEPLDFRAGFDGDEMMYNSEEGTQGRFGARVPYQFLHGFFSYGLLPTGAGEPRDLSLTRRFSLTSTKEEYVHVHGHWVDGAGHTKRLRTVDPLYGDLFGWTGLEYCNSGDYIEQLGIKDPHHRLPPYDANGLVRRICYSFLTTGVVVPAYLNQCSSDELFVKCLVQTFDHKRYVGLYAVNFDKRPHTLDVTLPIAFPEGTQAMVFDDRAWDWAECAQPLVLPGGKEFSYETEVPALGAWLVVIPLAPETLPEALGLPAEPVPVSPVRDAHVRDERPTFSWSAGAERMRYVVEVAREAIFRKCDRVELSDPVDGNSYTMKAAPQEQWRYFWRVRAVAEDGRSGPWSPPQPIVYKWPAYAEVYSPKEPAGQPVAEAEQPQPETPEWQRLADENGLESADNLAWQGEIFASAGFMCAPSRAVDGQAFSMWTNDGADGAYSLPSYWSVIWEQPVEINRVDILWQEGRVPKKFAIQVSDDATQWTDLFKTTEGAGLLTTVKLADVVKANYFRIYIKRAADENPQVGIREVVIR